MSLASSYKHNKTSLCSRCACLTLKPFTADCNDSDLKEIPEIWKDLNVPWRLSLNGNSLEEITVFPPLNNLTALSFRYKFYIADNAFLNLTRLVSLDLSHNNLTAESFHSDTFNGPYADKMPNPIPLEELDLSFNQIKRLPKDVFHHLKNLKYLKLSHNDFMDLSTTTAQALSEIQTLEKLDLSYTKLLLSELDLSGNSFPSVPSEINYAHSLEILRMDNNIFGTIYENSFHKTLEKLHTLSLTNSETLFRVENGAFGNLSSLQTLWLSDNIQLTTIYPRAFMNHENRTLHLKELHLENNKLERLPESALPWKDISSLNLADFGNRKKKIIITENELIGRYHISFIFACAAPEELMGYRVIDMKVQKHEFVCEEQTFNAKKYGYVVVATIVVGILLLVTGTIIFSYVLFRRTKVHDWIGNNVKYRRTLNEDEDVITSNIHY
ncbi:Keratocan [Armadillidium nasatum]|uniref:Keratocan n=1 Tax=Armadillidium nasatum TaxID=96803 RepID=A0A5N5T468_9CRUS|nr:Keratocan [Armadillidium nasatum]